MDTKAVQLIASEQLPGSSSEDRANLVWNGLVEVYGRQFVDSYGTSPPALWVEAIGGMTDKQLRLSFLALIKSGRKYPPNLSEFVAACRDPGVRYMGGPSSAYRPALPAPPVKRAIIDRYLANMRRRLGVPTDRA